jgi:RNase P subunit RPR2
MKRNEIRIDIDDIKIIMQDDFIHFQKILDNVFCRNCDFQTTTIVNYKAYLNKLNDIILKGECKKCGGKVARYIESGESEEKFAAADHIRNIKKNYNKI